ncbi:cuticle protein CP14.6-like [Daphnia carinata]|uniref:cuticle protein CP14.6-like n=1 Tax=Daphnia carinata TaxID=120202 RepID=UPI00257C5267|nr:cuticle protein CP14.6-like [Daphnia carinata]
MQLFLFATLLAMAAAVPSGTPYAGYKAPAIAIVAQSDVRNGDGSSQWSYAGSDGTTREESQAQKSVPGYKDSYGKDYESGAGNTNRGSSYYVSPEGQKISLTWVADEGGFQPKGDHLPVAPVHVYELPVAPALPYSRTGPGY